MNPAVDAGGGWKEAVISVSDLKSWVDVAAADFGWTLGHRGPVHATQLAAWGLPSGVVADQALFHCGDEAQGWVRFVQLAGAGHQLRIRAGAMPWDTGGIFSLMVRTRNMAALVDAVVARGWSLVTDPLTFDYNGQVLTNAILRGPDGVAFGAYERVKPTLAGWPHMKLISQPFNAMQMVRSRDATRDFHRDVLGFVAFVDDDTRKSKPEESNFGFPINLTTAYTTKAAIMHPRGKPGAKERDNGRVELIEWDGFDGRDLASRAAWPNLGIMMLRWAVADAAATANRLAGSGVIPARPCATAMVEPYGITEAFSLRTPDGVLYEVFTPRR